MGSLPAGLAFAFPKTAAVHACSFPLTQVFGLAHGVACALMLDGFLEYNAEALPDKLGYLSHLPGFEDVRVLAKRIRAMKKNMRMPLTLAEAGIGDEQLEKLVTESFHPNMQNNPRKVTKEDLMIIYAALKEDD